MKLYQVLNGYIGNGFVHVLVIANGDEDARRMASAAFKAEHIDRVSSRVGGYDPDYWSPSELRLEVLCEDVSRPWSSEARD